MSLLSICNNAANNVGVGAPTVIVGNSDPAAIRLLQLARRAAISLARKPQNGWTAQVVEHTFTADGTSDYALPGDFAKLVDDTLWDRTRFWRMRGAMSPQQWQFYKSSTLGNASIERRWRIRVPSGDAAGIATVFSIDPPVSSTDTSSEFVFEYVSKNWCQSATAYSVDELTPVAPGTGFVVGNVFDIAGGTATATAVGTVTALVSGTSGISTAEVVTPGRYTVKPSSPAGMTAVTGVGTGATFLINTTTMPGAGQSDWAADTDVSFLDEDLIEMGLIWRLQERLGFAYAETKDEYDREVEKAVAHDGGSAILSLAHYDRNALLGPWNVQEGNFPG